MTCEKAIEILEKIKVQAAYAMWENVSHESIELFDALTMAINALKNNGPQKMHENNELAKNILVELTGLDVNNHSLSEITCKITFGKGGSENEK